MEIYIRKHFYFDGDKYIENAHRNFLSYDNAKQSINDYISKLKHDYKLETSGLSLPYIKKQEENSHYDCDMYKIIISWNDDNLIHKEMFTIHREYVY